MNTDFLYHLDDTCRHNLVLVKCDSDSLKDYINQLNSIGVNTVNIGRELAEKIKTLESLKFLTIESQEYLHELIEKQAVHFVPGKLKVVAIYNIGILLEPTLSLNATNLIKEFSKNVTIIVLWDHINDDGLLHWGVQQEKYHLNLSDIYIAEGSAEYEV